MIPSATWFATSPEFRRLLAHAPLVRLAHVALEIAQDAYPGLDQAHYLSQLEYLAARVWDTPSDASEPPRPSAAPEDAGLPAAQAPRALLERLMRVLFHEEGFQGNTLEYYDVRNSYLNEVLERRLGIPISLCVLYQAVGAKIGLELQGVNLPGHFLLRWDGVGLNGGERSPIPPSLTASAGEVLSEASDSAAEPIFVDPYHGVLLDRTGCARRISQVVGQEVELNDTVLAPCPAPVVVARMLRNLKANYLRVGDFAHSLPIQRRLYALNPEDTEEIRDLGVICLRADHPGDAVQYLQIALNAQPPLPNDDRDTLSTLLLIAKRALARRN